MLLGHCHKELLKGIECIYQCSTCLFSVASIPRLVEVHGQSADYSTLQPKDYIYFSFTISHPEYFSKEDCWSTNQREAFSLNTSFTKKHYLMHIQGLVLHLGSSSQPFSSPHNVTTHILYCFCQGNFFSAHKVSTRILGHIFLT